MVLDTSVLIAIASRETEGEALTAVIEDEAAVVGAPTLVETHMVLRGGSSDPGWALGVFLASRNVEVMPFTAAHYEAASRSCSRARTSG